jgi:long-chain acyl-CoA synthetase
MNADTLPDLFRQQADRFGQRVALRFKNDGLYHDLRWNEYREQVYCCAAALVQHGIHPGDRVAILAENRVEWLVADMAILAAGAANVPLHAPLSAKQAHFQLDNAGVKWIFVSTSAQLEKIQQIRGDLPEVHGVVLFDDTHELSTTNREGEAPAEPAASAASSPAYGSAGASPSRVPITWRGFLQRGRVASAAVHEERRRRETHLTGDDLATIIYTSGTTGNPKGVMLTQRNLLSNALAFTEVSPIGPDSVILNWLPFSHIYARTVDIYVPLAVGATLCLGESADTVIADLATIEPTNMSGVPRFYEKVLAAVQHDDPTVFGKRLRAIFGPRIDFLGSGGAPLPVAVARAFQNAGLLVLQGYGLTESSPVISFNRRDHHKIETVGQALPGVEIRIGPDDEILTRGPHVMAGYWKNPEETAATIVNGWLHTGDLGRLDSEGFLTITGRKKDLLVLSNGKKVAPSHLEGILLGDPCIDQVVICGEGRNFLTALVVPHWGNVAQAMSLGEPIEAEALARDATVRASLETRIAQALAQQAAWERVQKIVVLAHPFTVANDEMTVSLKMRRNVIVERHRHELEALYRE